MGGSGPGIVIARALGHVAAHGRLVLIAGLVGGLTLPGAAAVLKGWLPELVGLLLFLTAARIGPHAALGGFRALAGSLGVVALYQLAAPLALFAALAATGALAQPLALAAVLMLAAPSVTGAPNFTILLGHDPAPALRVLIVGTALLPLTALPVLWLMPGLGEPAAVLAAAARLFAVIGGATAAGFALRLTLLSGIGAQGMRALDGLSALLLAVVVVGLMAALGPALAREPARLALWAAAAFALNFGAQILAFILRGRHRPDAVPLAIVAGNRNIALWLVALPSEVMEPLLIFIGCYQLPMYLTPILLRRLYERREP
ncbi:MAG: hypothetical protein D6811_03405 [Alphaproteobacteria bacterium]|nr:MAG: hypothetical protein D6811_03405 [Alphaproteobacteria bacterium]